MIELVQEYNIGGPNAKTGSEMDLNLSMEEMSCNAGFEFARNLWVIPYSSGCIHSGYLALDSNIFTFEILSNKDIYFKEIYAIKNGSRLEIDIGIWCPEKHYWQQLGSTDKWQRRSDLRGIQLSNALVRRKLYFLSRALLDIVGIMEQKLNFTTKIVEPEDQTFGALINGTWYKNPINLM